MRALWAVFLVGCFFPESDEDPPFELPPREVFEPLFERAPLAKVEAPLTLDTKSCTFARYWTTTRDGFDTFVLIHPRNARCEIWTGLFDQEPFNSVFEFCRYPREELISLDILDDTSFFIRDVQRCFARLGVSP